MDILQCINNIENKYPVSVWRVGDIDVWPIVRLGLMHENTILVSDNTPYKHNIFLTLIYEIKMLLLCLYITIRDHIHHESVHKSDVVFWGVNTDRTVKLSTGEFADQNLDMIKVELAKKGYVIHSLEYLSESVVKFPRYTKSDMSIYWKLFLVRCNSKMRKAKEDVFFPLLGEVKNYLKENGFGCSACDETAISNNIKSIKAVSECFFNLLKRTDAKMGVEMCWYWSLSMSFALACRKRGIPCVDVQHGVAGGNSHIAYAKWFNVPINGYNIMPTNFWCWSDKDAAAINEWYCSEHCNLKRAFVGGNNTQVYLLKNDLGNLWNKRLMENIIKDKIRVLVTLQPGVKLPEWFTDFIISTENIQWFIRQHPAMDGGQQEFIDKIKNGSNVEYEIASNCPLVSVLEVCNFHITSHSSVVVDAEPYGVKSVCLNEACFTYFQESIENGTCYYAKNAEDLNEIIEAEVACGNNAENKTNDVVDMSGIEELIKIINIQ